VCIRELTDLVARLLYRLARGQAGEETNVWVAAVGAHPAVMEAEEITALASFPQVHAHGRCLPYG
jgi:hypothetical protein